MKFQLGAAVTAHPLLPIQAEKSTPFRRSFEQRIEREARETAEESYRLSVPSVIKERAAPCISAISVECESRLRKLS